MHAEFRSALVLAAYVVAITGVGATAEAASPPPVAVLEPAQERAAARLFDLDHVDLAEGVTIDGLALLQDRIELTVMVGGQAHVLALWPPGTAREGSLTTPSGPVTGTQPLPEPARAQLQARLSGADRPVLRWRLLVMAVDAVRAEQEAGAVGAGFRGGAPVRPAKPAVTTAVAALLRGEGSTALDQTRPMLCGRRAPPAGSVSVWLAAGGAVPSGDADCAAADLIDAFEREALGSEPLARWSDEPRVLVRAAEVAADQGHLDRAGALLRQALAAPLADEAAHALAVRWGWSVESATGPKLPARAAVAEVDRSTPWTWLAAMLLVLALMAVLVRDGPRLPRLALAAGVVGGAGLLTALTMARAPAELRVPAPEPAEDGWLQLGRGTACVVSAPALTPSSWQVLVRCRDGDAGVAVVGGVEPSASRYERTEAHSLSLMPFAAGGRVGPELERWIRRVLVDIDSLERAGSHLGTAGADEVALTSAPPASALSRIASRPAWQGAGLMVSGVVAAVALPCLLLLLWLALRDLMGPSATRRWRALLFAALCATAIAHAVSPGRMVMVYSGYTQTASLISWEPLRYGAGGNWLYGPWLHLFSADHATVQGINRVYGVLGTLLLAAFVGRLKPQQPVAALAALVFIGAAPLMWRDHASESILVGGWLMLVATLYGLAAAAERPTVGLLAAPCAMLAATTRPELALAAVPLGLLLLLHSRPSWSRRTWLGVALTGVAVALMAVPHVAYLQQMLDMLRATEALPGLSGLGSRFTSELMGLSGLTVAVRHGPILLVAFLPLALVLARGHRLLALGIVIVVFAWTGFTKVDLPEVSMPRVHAPPWTLFAVVAALGFGATVTRVTDKWGSRAGVGTAAVLLLAYLGSAAASAPALYAQTNADTEEELIRRTTEALPAGAVCLTTIDYPDPPDPGKTHRMIPGYLFEESHPDLRILGIREFAGPELQCPDGAYALLGMRCYMALREDETEGPAPRGSQMVEACQSLRDAWELEPVIEWDAVNHGDVAFPMYPDGSTLRVGLYRVTGPR